MWTSHDRVVAASLDWVPVAVVRYGEVKQRRAYGGCLGARRRRRTWIAAICYGEPLNRP